MMIRNLSTLLSCIILLSLANSYAQNVGIGVVQPNAKLHVVGNSSTAGSSALLVENSNAQPLLLIRDNGQVGVGTSSPDASAILDLSSTTLGFLVPRLTQTQRDAISNPALGLQVFNLTSTCLQIWLGSSWVNVACCSPQPVAPTSVSAAAGNTQVTVSFSGGTGTSYTVSSSPGNFTASGTSSPITVTGLANGTAYTFTVVANGPCGNSGPSAPSASVTPIAYTPGSQSFTTAGSSTFTVPAGVTSITIECWGAQGEGGGGLGGYAKGTMTVTPGTNLQVNVGGQNGYNGGGTGASGRNGGGASDVRTGSYTLNDRVIVAGGGGGQGSSGSSGLSGGGGAGMTCTDGAAGAGGMCSGCSPYAGSGGDGTCSSGGNGGTAYGGHASGGGGGGMTAGGAGSPSGGYGNAGGSGTFGIGGNRGFNSSYSTCNSGAGGGGGWYGGGGSADGQCSAGNGGGGSSYASPSLTNRVFTGSVQSGNGRVTITW